MVKKFLQLRYFCDLRHKIVHHWNFENNLLIFPVFQVVLHQTVNFLQSVWVIKAVGEGFNLFEKLVSGEGLILEGN